MRLQVFFVVLSVVGIVLGSPAAELNSHQDDTNLNTHRDEKVFFAILQISPDECTTSDTTRSSGTCLPPQNCPTADQSGSCAQGVGSCCIVSRTCSGSSSFNNTYFTEPTTVTTGACTLTVNRVNDNICQARLDFVNLELSEPGADGACDTDFFTVTGGTSTPPMICGSNTGQHMYVDMDPAGGPLKLTVDRSSASPDSTNNWDIQVTQIPCTSRYRAPAGCLQYYTETSGTVSSFNFKQDAPTLTDGTREIADLDYGVCVQMADGYCGIIWERNTTGDNYGFSVSSDVGALAPTLIGDPAASSIGSDCTTDYVVIPGGVYTDTTTSTEVQNDRFCGAGFPDSVTSTSKPFALYYHTDADETPDSQNRGFSLNYRQTSTC